MEIKILGTGCAKCKKLERRVRKAVDEMGIEADIIKVEDIEEIMQYNILSTPGLVVDGELRLAGQLPKVDYLKSLINPISLS